MALEYVPGTNLYWAMRVKVLAQGNNESLWVGCQTHTKQAYCSTPLIVVAY